MKVKLTLEDRLGHIFGHIFRGCLLGAATGGTALIASMIATGTYEIANKPINEIHKTEQVEQYTQDDKLGFGDTIYIKAGQLFIYGLGAAGVLFFGGVSTMAGYGACKDFYTAIKKQPKIEPDTGCTGNQDRWKINPN